MIEFIHNGKKLYATVYFSRQDVLDEINDMIRMYNGTPPLVDDGETRLIVDLITDEQLTDEMFQTFFILIEQLKISLNEHQVFEADRKTFIWLEHSIPQLKLTLS